MQANLVCKRVHMRMEIIAKKDGYIYMEVYERLGGTSSSGTYKTSDAEDEQTMSGQGTMVPHRMDKPENVHTSNVVVARSIMRYYRKTERVSVIAAVAAYVEVACSCVHVGLVI